MNLLETPAAGAAPPAGAAAPAAGGAPGSAASGAVKQAGGVPAVGTLAAHPKTATTTTEAAPAIMSATAFDTSATRALQVAAPVKPASGTGGPSGQVHSSSLSRIYVMCHNSYVIYYFFLFLNIL